MRLRYTRHAHDDLVALFEFIAKDDAPAAQNVSRTIRTGIDRLLQFPSYGRIGDVEGTRQFVVTGVQYIVVYEIEDQTITILRIYHGARERPGTTRRDR